MTASNPNGSGLSNSERDLEDDMSPRSPPERALSGLSGLSARCSRQTLARIIMTGHRLNGKASHRNVQQAGGGRPWEDGPASLGMRRGRDVSMSSKIATKRDLEDEQDREQKWVDGKNRVRTMEWELNEFRRVSVGWASSDTATPTNIVFSSGLKIRVTPCCRSSWNWTL